MKGIHQFYLYGKVIFQTTCLFKYRQALRNFSECSWSESIKYRFEINQFNFVEI